MNDNRYFGAPWNPSIAQMEQAPTPLGEPCLHCGEAIQDGDQGELINGGTAPVHQECLLRMIVGSVGHQLMTCPCFGGDRDDPVGMTKRQAAIAAARMYEAKMQRRN